MPETIDEITINFSDQSENLLVKELKKEVLTRGGWTTIMFLYQDLDQKTGGYGESKVSIRRYRKIGGEFRQQSKFNISGRTQGLKVAEVLTRWFSGDAEAG
jgi:hypothetical protein